MGKLKAHYPLSRIKALVREGHYCITARALKTAFEDFSLCAEEIGDLFLTLEMADLYKSMTSRYDSSLWQDVYHKAIGGKMAYIKVQIFNDETVVISFKEK